ncbi:nuclease domain-containing protein, partial [Diplogelasinospora grovesii]
TMPWGLWRSPTSAGKGKDQGDDDSSTSPPVEPVVNHPSSVPNVSPPPKKSISWNDSLNATDWQHYTEPRNWVPTVLVTATALGFLQFYRSYLRRIPGTNHITPSFFRKRSLLGKVTSVGDGDNFHLFHTPGGLLAGWGWLRSIPKNRKELKGHTIPVRIAGIDAPENAHFGKPAQPFAAEALEFLRSYILGRRVRAYIYRRDQYERVVATVFVRRPPFYLRTDVGLEMIKKGLATTYEAKSGAEFGGPKTEAIYKEAEAVAKRKGRGMWTDEKGGLFGLGTKKEVESPRAFKDRMKAMDEKNGKNGKIGKIGK